jgi:nicotinate phosphoribosyltransferase
MRIDEPILTSMLDDDLYKLTSAAVVFHNFPRALVRYEFINRGKTKFPSGFDEELYRQIQMMEFLRLTDYELEWLKTNVPYLPPTFLEWFRHFSLNSKEVSISLFDGNLKIEIAGPWYRTIFWEVKLMAVISELYFRLTKHHMDADWEKKIIKKAQLLSNSECRWMEFGTRRRYSFAVQDRVVDIMGQYGPYFQGTSNPYLAYKYKTEVKGTYPHEVIMAMSSKYGALAANAIWLDLWQKYYGVVNTALTDTYTSDLFFSTVPHNLNILGSIRGLRQDSGDPDNWADRQALPWLKKHGINPHGFNLIFSDALTAKSYKRLDIKYRKIVAPMGGIGTHLTNDVGAEPLNIVIKMTWANLDNDSGLKARR